MGRKAAILLIMGILLIANPMTYSILFRFTDICEELKDKADRRDALSKIGNELNLDISGGTMITNKDSHGGFHGEGVSLTIIQFDDENLKELIENNDNWNAFPLNETAQGLLYGYKRYDGMYGPFLTDEDGNPLVPPIKNGYYWLKDRQVRNEEAPGADLIHRSSLNLDVAVYDLDSGILYYCKFDT